MTLKNGSAFDLGLDGSVIYDGDRHMTFERPNGHEWRIVGFSRRHHSRQIISLEDAANGADLGQGWVHDIDHGTRRMWGMPRNRRAVRVERI